MVMIAYAMQGAVILQTFKHLHVICGYLFAHKSLWWNHKVLKVE